MANLYNFTLTGRVPSKKNNKRIVHSKFGRPFLISSDQHNEWHKQAKEQLSHLSNEGINFPISVSYRFYMPDNRKCDLSNKIESINDLLVDINFIEDDNWKILKEIHIYATEVDKQNPRVEISIDEL